MKKLLALSLIIISSITLAAQAITPSDVVNSPEKYDKKVIKVRGIVKKFKTKISKAGNDYILFDLTSGSEKIVIFGRGKLERDLVDGDKVEVEGVFNKFKTVRSATFKNELDCSGRKGEKPKISTVK